VSPELLSRVEDASLNASAPPQQRWLDGWLVRFNPGKAKRARSINAVAAGRLPVERKLALAEPVYREAGLELLVRITPFSQPEGLDGTLAGLGLSAFDETCVMVMPSVSGITAGSLPRDCRVEQPGPAEFAEAVGALRQSPPSQREAQAQRLANSPVPYQGWLVRRGDAVLGCAQVAREGEFVGLYDVFTHPGARGQGLATALCAQLLKQAAAQGACFGYLQVDAGNSPAISVYRRLGFAVGYRYHYRARNPAAA
jgi:ribosomal protein S18 acetylase RimI-like enzyme